MLSNARAVQAVLARGAATGGRTESGGDDHVLSVVFFEAGAALSTPNASAFGGVRLVASRPCIAVLTAAVAGGERGGGAAPLMISVAEPTQTLAELELQLSGSEESLGKLSAQHGAEGGACCAQRDRSSGGSGAGAVSVRVALPQGERAGSTVTCELCG